jgi:hypothetical protein
MASVGIFNKVKQRFSSISNKEVRDVFFKTVGQNINFVDRERNTKLYEKSYPLSKFSFSSHSAIPESQLPFRVKFVNIGIEGYGPNNPAPIGIAVIGFNNYIL